MMIYTKVITDDEIKCLEHYVSDVTEWIDQAIEGKINSCKKRIFKGEIDKAITNDSPLPATQAEVFSTFFADPDYKSRRVRDGLPPKEVIVETPIDVKDIKEEPNGQPA